jgi:hypothetical protein
MQNPKMEKKLLDTDFGETTQLTVTLYSREYVTATPVTITSVAILKISVAKNGIAEYLKAACNWTGLDSFHDVVQASELLDFWTSSIVRYSKEHASEPERVSVIR